jgi:hypothetical protein
MARHAPRTEHLPINNRTEMKQPDQDRQRSDEMSRLPGALDFSPSFYHQEALHEAELRRKEHAAREAHHGTGGAHSVVNTFQQHLVAVAAGLVAVLGAVALM